MTYKDLLNRNLPDELPDGFSASQLTGDASSRAYYRIRDSKRRNCDVDEDAGTV